MNSNFPEVTVILPVFNAERHAASAVEHLLRQSFQNFELIVVDDGSSDRTSAIVQSFASKDQRVSLVRLSGNAGVANARNIAIQRAQGRWLWFVDVDDHWSTDFLSEMHTIGATSRADLVLCGANHKFGTGLRKSEAVVRYRDSRAYTGAAASAVVLRGSGALWNKLFRADAVPQKMFPLLASKSDHAGLLGALPRINTVVTVPRVLYVYVQRDGSISNGGVKAPQNFLELLPLLDLASARYPDSKLLLRAVASSRIDILGRALRETWRFHGTESPIVHEAARQITLRDLLLSLNVGVRTLCTCVAAKLLPGVAGRLFRRIGAQRWNQPPARAL